MLNRIKIAIVDPEVINDKRIDAIRLLRDMGINQIVVANQIINT
jgi:hypothetical protein